MIHSSASTFSTTIVHSATSAAMVPIAAGESNPRDHNARLQILVARDLNEITAGHHHRGRDTRPLFVSCSAVIDRSS